MRLIDQLQMIKAFLKIKPTASQIINSIKYSFNYFGGGGCSRPLLKYHPISIGVYVTFKCNIRCAKCFNYCVNKEEYIHNDFSIQDFARLLKSSMVRDAFRVSFVGGEPLMNKDIFAMIKMSSDAKKLTMFPTNGLLIEKRIDEFKHTPLTSIQISLYNEHLEKQLKAVDALKRHNKLVNICISHWVTRDTYKEIENVIDIAKDFKIKNIIIQNFLPRPGIPPTDEEVNAIITHSDTHILEYFDYIKKRYGNKFNISLPMPLGDIKDRWCIHFSTVVFVDKFMNMYPCCAAPPSKAIFGNIESPSAWNSDFFQFIRKNFNKNFPVMPECMYCYYGSNYQRPII